MRTSIIIAFIATCLGVASAQQPLTNQDVIRMEKAGMGDQVVMAAIRTQPNHFMLSTSDLIALKQAGVSNAVLAAMLTAVAPLPTSSARLADVPAAPGAYYKGPNGPIMMDQQMMSGGGLKHMGKMFIPLAGAMMTPQMVYTFRGAHAPLQIAEAKPVFYVRQFPNMAALPGQSAQDIVIVRMSVKKRDRELQYTSGGNVFTFKAGGFTKAMTPEITVTRLSDTLLSVSPVNNLIPGEYLLTDAGLGTSGYDFGIQPTPAPNAAK